MNVGRARARRLALSLLIALAAPSLGLRAHAQTFDHSHASWTALLKRHVVLIDGGKASRLQYAGVAADVAQFKAYTAALSAVSAALLVRPHAQSLESAIAAP